MARTTSWNFKVQNHLPFSRIIWRIGNFLNGQITHGMYCESPEFVTYLNVPVRWKFGVNGRDTEGDNPSTKIFLWRTANCTASKDVSVRLRLWIKDKIGKIWFQEFFIGTFLKDKKGYHFHLPDALKFDNVLDTSRTVLSTNGTVVLYCDMIANTVECIDEVIDDDLKLLSQNFNAFSVKNILCDFILRCKYDDLNVHKVILNSRSSYVANRLRQNPDIKDLDLTKFGEQSHIEEMVKFWYSGDIKPLLRKYCFSMSSFIRNINQKGFRSIFLPQIIDMTTKFEVYSCTVSWIIENYSLCENHEKIEGPVFYQDIRNEETAWRLVLHPKGTKDDPNHISIFVQNVKGVTDFPIHLEVSFLKHDNQRFCFKSTLSWLHPTTDFGFPRFIGLSKFQESRYSFIIRDSLRIYCVLKFSTGDTTHDVDVISNSAVIAALPGNHYRHFATDMKNLYESKTMTDAVFVVGAKKFSVHKFVMAARSTFFEKYFTDFQVEEFSLNEIDAETFEMILKYLYYAEPVQLNLENAVKLYPFALKYKFKGLSNLCHKYLELRLNLDNVLDIIEAAYMFDDLPVKESARQFIIGKWDDVTKSDAWMRFKTNNKHFAEDIQMRALEHLNKDI